jgi:hypothetical protein
MGSRTSSFTGVLAALVVVPVAATAGPQTGAPTYGFWSERDANLDFEVRPGSKPDQLVLVIPLSASFPASHEFVLDRRTDGAFAPEEHHRPKILLSFQSSAKAILKVRGQGATSSGTWIAMNDYTLVRR